MVEPLTPGERLLSGPDKAAALLLMLGPPTAGRLLKHFDQPDLRVLVRAAAGLGAIAPATLNRLVDEFTADFSSGTNVLGDVGQARTLLAEALPEAEVDELMGSALGEEDGQDVWRLLGKMPESAIVRFLTDERPATATYILSRLDPPLAARIVSALPRDRRNAALCGLIAPYTISSLASEVVETAIREMLKANENATGGDKGPARIADIINNLEPEAAEDVMRAIGESRPRDAAILKTMLFSFNDLPRLSERARALLFDRASIDIVVMALRGTDSDFRNAVLSSMPSRGRRLVEGELSSGASAPARDVAKARKAIADIVLDMAARNEIEIIAPPADEAA
jgi:flagellar motor switch protein FliG